MARKKADEEYETVNNIRKSTKGAAHRFYATAGKLTDWVGQKQDNKDEKNK